MGHIDTDRQSTSTESEDEHSSTRRAFMAAGAMVIPGLQPNTYSSVGEPTLSDQPIGGWAFSTLLTAGTPTAGARFGYAADIHGDRVFIGAEADDTAVPETGAVHVFDSDDNGWTHTQTLTAHDGSTKDSFGGVIALDGTRALVGARGSDSPEADSGAAYVFELDNERWIQTQKLVADDGRANDRFGRGVALDGPLAVVGARQDDNAAKDAGAAYVFELEDDRWVQTQKLTAADADANDRFGRVVAIDRGRIFIGARIDDGAAPDAGAVYVFELDGNQWSQTQKLTAANARKGDRFGGAVAVGGDRALIGAGRDDEVAEDGGAVYAFAFIDGEWRQTQKLTPEGAAPGTRFGSAVAIDRDTAFIGAEHDNEHGSNAGAVYVFELEDNRWRSTQKLTRESSGPDTRFGSAVALDGNRGIIGAIGDDEGVAGGGAAYVITKEATTNPDSGGSFLEIPKVLPVVEIVAGLIAIVSGVVAAVRYFSNR